MPLWLLIVLYLFLLTFVISIWAALGNNPALIALLAVTGLLILVMIKSALVIEVDATELRVGKAHIELMYVGMSVALTPQEMKNIRTRDADASAFLAIRFWNPHGVKLEINDIRDSTPYWLITSKKSQQLAELLNSQRD